MYFQCESGFKIYSETYILPGKSNLDFGRVMLAKSVCSGMCAVTTFSVIIEEKFGWSILLPQGIPIPRDFYIFCLFRCRNSTEGAVDGAGMCEGNPDKKGREWPGKEMYSGCEEG